MNDIEKHENFERILSLRMKNLGIAINRIGHLSNRYNYRFTDDDVDKLFVTIESMVKKLETKFRSTLKEPPVGEKRTSKIAKTATKPEAIKPVPVKQKPVSIKPEPEVKSEPVKEAEQEASTIKDDEVPDFLKKASA